MGTWIHRKHAKAIMLSLTLAVGLTFLAWSRIVPSMSSQALPASAQLEMLKRESREEFPWLHYYAPQVAGVMAGNRFGQLVGPLVSSNASGPTRNIYLFDPARSTAVKVREVGRGWEILSAAIDGEWISWTEKSKTGWVVYARRLVEQDPVAIAEGRYGRMTGDDFPSLALDGGSLVYNVSEETQSSMVSRIVMVDLSSRERRVLQEVRGDSVYLGAPSGFGRYVVWHQGEWRSPPPGKMFLYDSKANQTRELRVPNQAISPEIWGKRIAYVCYDESRPESKSIYLYDIETGETECIADAGSGRYLEYWGPSIVAGIVTWRSNDQSRGFPLLTIATKDLRHTHPEATVHGVTGVWLWWKDESAGPGTLLAGLVSSWWTSLDLSSVEEAIGPATITEDVVEHIPNMPPPQVYALCEEILRQGHVDLLPQVITSDWYDEHYEDYRLEVIADARHREIRDFKVSPIYVAEGDHAVIRLEHLVVEGADGTTVDLGPYNLRMVYENGRWRVPPMAAQ